MVLIFTLGYAVITLGLFTFLDGWCLDKWNNPIYPRLHFIVQGMLISIFPLFFIVFGFIEYQ